MGTERTDLDFSLFGRGHLPSRILLGSPRCKTLQEKWAEESLVPLTQGLQAVSGLETGESSGPWPHRNL